MTAAEYRALMANKAKKRAANKAKKSTKPPSSTTVEKGPVGEATGERLVTVVETFGAVTVTHMIPESNTELIKYYQKTA